MHFSLAFSVIRAASLQTQGGPASSLLLSSFLLQEEARAAACMCLPQPASRVCPAAHAAPAAMRECVEAVPARPV